MLENIKSGYILKDIFAYFDKKRRMRLVKYNKILQTKLNVTFNDYKNFSGKYIIYDKKGKGKIYNIDNNVLIYEGDIIDGIRIGEGKEYDINGGIIFKGKYLNGEKNGKGKEYYESSNIKFEGEYLNGKKWTGKGYTNSKINKEYVSYILEKGKGLVKEYDEINQLIFEGEYLNGEKNGKGKEYQYINNNTYREYKYIFEGEYLNGLKNGKGKEFNKYHNLVLFEGEYLNGERNGKGKEYYDNHKYPNPLKFHGEYLIGLRNGFGREYYLEGNIKFEGEFLNGRYWNGQVYDLASNNIYEIKEGNGIIIEHYDNGNIKFEGEYLNGERNGKGKEYYDNNDKILKYEGEYLNGKRDGKGKEYYIDGKIKFEGEYLNGKQWNGNGHRHANNYLFNNFTNKNIIFKLVKGKGYFYEFDDEGRYLKFKGEYLNGERNGEGIIYSDKREKNVIFKGEYLNGEKNGKGKEYDDDGKLIFEGEYLNGMKNGKGKEYYSFFQSTKQKNKKMKDILIVKLIFDGEYKNGKRNGKGKEYLWNGKLKFDGE